MTDPTLAMVSITIALGLMYVSLPGARYRERLFNAIVNVFRSREMSECAAGRVLGRLVDNNVSTHYQTLSMWWAELPLEKRDQVPDPYPTLFDSGTDRRKAPRSYRWFRYNVDRGAVFVVAVTVPITLLWMVVLGIVQASEVSWIGWIAVGQVLVAGHVVFGWSMQGILGRRIGHALTELVNAVEEEHVRTTVQPPPEPPKS